MHSITGKLNNPANVFQAGESTGFGIRLGVKYRDPKTKTDEYTNYSAVIFAKSPGQVKFYQDVLIAGSVVEVSAEQLKVGSFDGKNGTVLSIDMLNARLGYVFSGQSQSNNAQTNQQAAPQQQQAHQQQAPQQQQQYQQAPQQQYAPQQSPMAQNPNASQDNPPF